MYSIKMDGDASTTGGKREKSPSATLSQPSTKRARQSSAPDKPIFGRLDVTADIDSEDIIQISSKRLGENRPVIDHLSDNTFALRGPREQAHAMIDKILNHSDKATFTCIARLVSDTEKAVISIPAPAMARNITHGGLDSGIGETKAVPTSELDCSVLSRGSLDAAMEKWSAWGRPDIKLKLLVDEMTSLEPQDRSFELLVMQDFAHRYPKMSVAKFDSIFLSQRRRSYDLFAAEGKTQVGKDFTRFTVLIMFWAVRGHLEVGELWKSLGLSHGVEGGDDDPTSPWNELRPNDMAGGLDLLYESFLQERKQERSKR